MGTGRDEPAFQLQPGFTPEGVSRGEDGVALRSPLSLDRGRRHTREAGGDLLSQAGAVPHAMAERPLQQVSRRVAAGNLLGGVGFRVPRRHSSGV